MSSLPCLPGLARPSVFYCPWPAFANTNFANTMLLALLLNPLSFTLGLRPPPSARSTAGSLQMVSDLEGMLIEQDRMLREVEDDLREYNKIQSDNIQSLVSWPDPPHNRPLPRSPPPSPPPPPCPQLSPKLRHVQREINEDMKAQNEAVDRYFESLQRMALELLTPTAPAPSSLPTPPSSSSPAGV